MENDFLYNNVLCINHHGFNGVIGAIPFIFCGNELKKNINKFKNKKIYSLFILFYIGNNYLRSYLIKKTGELIFIKWYSSFGLINCFFLFIFVYSIYDFLNNKIIYFIITNISNKTFYIYLVHVFVMNNIFRAFNFDKKFYKKNFNLKNIIYYQSYSVFIVFTFSLFISIGFLIYINIFDFLKKMLIKKTKKI